VFTGKIFAFALWKQTSDVTDHDCGRSFGRCHGVEAEGTSAWTSVSGLGGWDRTLSQWRFHRVQEEPKQNRVLHVADGARAGVIVSLVRVHALTRITSWLGSGRGGSDRTPSQWRFHCSAFRWG
jgi:hypothetical protein